MALADDGINLFDVTDAGDGGGESNASLAPHEPNDAAGSGESNASLAPHEPNGEAGGGALTPQGAAPQSPGDGSSGSAAAAPDSPPPGESIQVNGVAYRVGNNPGEVPPALAAEIRQKREFQASVDRYQSRLERIERENEQLRQQAEQRAAQEAPAPKGATPAPPAGDRLAEMVAKAQELDRANGYGEGEGYGPAMAALVEEVRQLREAQQAAQPAIQQASRGARLTEDFGQMSEQLRLDGLDPEGLVQIDRGKGLEAVPLREAAEAYYYGAEQQARQRGMSDTALADAGTRAQLMMTALYHAQRALNATRRQGGVPQRAAQAPRAATPPPPGVYHASTPRASGLGAFGEASERGPEVVIEGEGGQPLPSGAPMDDFDRVSRLLRG